MDNLTPHSPYITFNHLEPLLTERELAKLTHLSVTTLRKRRALGLEPPFVKLGGAVRYTRPAVIDWITAAEER